MNSALAPNCTVRDDSLRNKPSIQPEKLDYLSYARISDRSGSSLISVTSSSPLRARGNNFTVNPPAPISNCGQGITNLNILSSNNGLE